MHAGITKEFNIYLNGLSDEMTVNDIDVIQYKRKLNIIRIIESKHSRECWKNTTQFELLERLARLVKQISGCSVYVYLVRGDKPYNKLIVKNLTTGKLKTLYGDDVRKWCEFEIIDI